MISTPAPILRNLLPAVLAAFMGVGCAGVVLSAVPRVTAAEPRAATGPAPAHSLAVWLAALAEVETGNDPAAVGRAGERTPYQISPRVWAAYSRQPMRSATAAEGRRVATRILGDRAGTFRRRHGREPSLAELYLLWHRPARVFRPTPVERARAKRFAAVVVAMAGDE